MLFPPSCHYYIHLLDTFHLFVCFASGVLRISHILGVLPASASSDRLLIRAAPEKKKHFILACNCFIALIDLLRDTTSFLCTRGACIGESAGVAATRKEKKKQAISIPLSSQRMISMITGCRLLARPPVWLKPLCAV